MEDSRDTNTWIFTYGPDMQTRDLPRWLNQNAPFFADILVESQGAILPDHRLVWDYFSPTRRGGAANVERQLGSEVAGVAIRIKTAGLCTIDRKEGHPRRYSRGGQRCRVRLLRSGTYIDAWVYKVLPPYRETQFVPPRRRDLATMIEGARQFALPRAYIAFLQQTQTVD